MLRAFMTVQEACDVVVTAASHALAAARGYVSVYVLNMGQPVKIVNLAERLIRLSRFEPSRDIEIIYTGMRPGERFQEFLFSREEESAEIGIPGIVAARPVKSSLAAIRAWFAQLELSLAKGERPAIYRILHDAVLEFRGAAITKMAQDA